MDKNYGKIIINELYLPTRDRTIQTTKLGGFAGGTKYLVRDILFKVSIDSFSIYGDDSFASKVATHEVW